MKEASKRCGSPRGVKQLEIKACHIVLLQSMFMFEWCAITLKHMKNISDITLKSVHIH